MSHHHEEGEVVVARVWPVHPVGKCGCGCGRTTALAKETNSSRGQVKGQPLRCVLGHHIKPPVRWRVADGGFDSPCWRWLGHVNAQGYGRVYDVDGRERNAHRVLYRLLVGPIPEGLQLDHLCRNRDCVNPAHLEPVTQQENLRRGVLARRRQREVSNAA